jgi:hypothetical protein
MKFKKGDKVICIDNKYVEDALILNNQYTVTNIFHNSIKITTLEHKDRQFLSNRFKLDEKQFRNQKIKQLKGDF